jgi:hypothetical protein
VISGIVQETVIFSGLGATVRLKVHSGEIVEGRVVHLWEEKSVPMVRVASGDLVCNVPASMLIDERESK